MRKIYLIICVCIIIVSSIFFINGGYAKLIEEDTTESAVCTVSTEEITTSKNKTNKQKSTKTPNTKSVVTSKAVTTTKKAVTTTKPTTKVVTTKETTTKPITTTKALTTKAVITTKAITSTTKSTGGSPALYTAARFKYLGVVRYNGYRWTWYSDKVLPGGGLNIPGRHYDSQNFICDKDGYICLASNRLKKGTVINTPFGKKGKIYDCGCPIGTIDVYVHF